MAKHKQAVNPLAELHFISAVQLEEALEVLQGMVSPATPITLTELSEDAWQFEMWFKRYKTTTDAYIKGTLSRWQGTFTRVDCTGDVQRGMSVMLRQVSPLQKLLGTLISASGLILFVVSGVPLFSGDDPNGFLLGVALCALVIGVYLSGGNLSTRSMNPQMLQTQVRFRERDFLFQKIINAFRNAGQVSYDGSHLEDGEIVAVKSLPLQQQDK